MVEAINLVESKSKRHEVVLLIDPTSFRESAAKQWPGLMKKWSDWVKSITASNTAKTGAVSPSLAAAHHSLVRNRRNKVKQQEAHEERERERRA